MSGARAMRFAPLRLATTALPFVLIAGVFAAFVARHLAGPDARRDRAGRLEWLLAHEDAPLPAVADDDQVVLQRSGCAGDCPAYELRILGSGRAVFVGNGNVCRVGTVAYAIRRPQAQQLIAALSAIGFAALPDPHGRTVPDLRGEVTVQLRAHGGEHRVRRALAVVDAAPLYEVVERSIDRVGNDLRWLPVPDDAGHLACAGPQGRTPPLSAEGFQPLIGP